MSNQKQTSKKQRFLENKVLVDPDTGESYPVQINEIKMRDFNFHKVWMQHLINSFEDISNKKLKLAFWIVDNLDKENQLIMSQSEICKKTGLSKVTVNKTIRALCNPSDKETKPFLQQISKGGCAYRVNPEVLFKGSYNNRMGICFKYTDTEKAKLKELEQKQKKLKESSQEESQTIEKKEIPVTLEVKKIKKKKVKSKEPLQAELVLN